MEGGVRCMCVNGGTRVASMHRIGCVCVRARGELPSKGGASNDVGLGCVWRNIVT
jgi:hypothetical protein